MHVQMYEFGLLTNLAVFIICLPEDAQSEMQCIYSLVFFFSMTLH
jgi:hypothetical protein